MNIKLHTPKSLKAGSGLSSLKQFLLSLFATSVSIALTFGTAAIIDYYSKQKAKREIVMMVMYDMYNSLEAVQKADSLLHKAINLQLQIAEDTTKFEELKFNFVHLTPTFDYTETTERIFSSNIETINTVGNVLFTENVAIFYYSRKTYKELVCDSVAHRLQQNSPHHSVKSALDFDYSFDVFISSDILLEMQHKFAQCKQMMDVTDKEIEAYRKQRKQLEENSSEKAAAEDSIRNEVVEITRRIVDARKKLNLK